MTKLKTADPSRHALQQMYSRLNCEDQLCDEWLKGGSAFFIEWARKGFMPGMSLRRINESKAYGPDNTVWVKARSKPQPNNAASKPRTSRGKLVTWEGDPWDGKQFTYSELAIMHFRALYGERPPADGELGECYRRIYDRIHYGRWDVRLAVETCSAPRTGSRREKRDNPDKAPRAQKPKQGDNVRTKYPGKLNWLNRKGAVITDNK